MARKPRIPPRRRIFLGCEGESERGYAALLSRLVEARHQRTHLEGVLLRPGGGDPLALVELAIDLARRKAGRDTPWAAKAILLDTDTLGRAPDRDATARRRAAVEGFRLIWQTPCHEGLLLRHLAETQALRPANPQVAQAELLRRWPDYRKGMAAVRLAGRITEDDVRRAAAGNEDLAVFLVDIGFGAD